MAVTTFDRDGHIELIRLMTEQERRDRTRQILTYYPDNGPLRRELYAQHMAFFRLGSTCSIRGFVAGNRIGKTLGSGGYETVLHLTGRYPAWWEGRRFDRPINAWCAGDTKETTRDIIQQKLMGSEASIGEGLIPGDLIGKIRYRTNGNGAIDTVMVKHVTGGWSELGFKSYEQGRISFQGTERDLIWLDEEADEGIRSECIMRLMTTNGLLIETFTPLKGLTPIVMKYMPDGYNDERIVVNGDRALIMAGWDDVPHLGEAEKQKMLAECEPHLIDARTKGIPHIGSGAIYPVPETDVFVDDIPIPEHWPKAYALDVGWNKTASLFMAHDKDSDVVYVYSEYGRGQAEPSIHASAINARKVRPGVIDPAARGRSQHDGSSLMEIYRSLGLSLSPADNSVEAGIYEVWQRLSSGRIKIFKSCIQTRQEYRMYRRDDRGRVVKENDHFMDCLRYLVMSGLQIASNGLPVSVQYGAAAGGWMG